MLRAREERLPLAFGKPCINLQLNVSLDKKNSGSCRLLILSIVMLMTKGGNFSPLFSYRPLPLQMNNMNWGEKLFLSHIWKPVRFFFFFCSVNPNLRDLKPTFPFKTESLFVFFFLDEEEGKKNEIPQRYFLPFCTRKLPSLGGSQFVSNFSHLSLLRQVSWEKASPVQTMVLMGTSVRGCWSGAPSESSLQMVLNVGDWGAVPSVPCPLPGPVKPNRICHKSGSQRGLWRRGVCAHRAVWLVHCRLACARPGETSDCLSLPRSPAPDGTTRASK